ncbi:MAG: SR-related CTD-associated factor [Marteilia pararefringens]
MMLNELQKETERELHLVPSKQLPKGCMEKPIIDPFAMMLDGSIAKSTEKRQIQEGQKNPEASHSDSNSDFSNNPPNRLPKSEKNSDTDLKLEQNKPSLEAEEILKFEEFKPYLKPQHVVVLSDTVWIGKLPKNYPEVHIMRDIENFGEIINIRYISTRGCAYVQMMQRSDAELLKNKYQSIKPTNKFDFPRSQLKLAWAPPTDLKDLLKSFWSLSLGIFLIPWSFFTSQMFDKIKYCNSFLLHCTLPPNFGPLIMSNDLLLDYQIRSDLQQLKKPVNINKEKDLSFSKKLTNLKRETSSETERYNNPTDPKYSACPEASPSKMRKRSGSPSLSQNNTNSDNNKYKQIKTNQTRPQSHNYSSQMHAQNSRVSRDNKSRHGSSSSRERVSNNSSNSSNAKSTSSSRNQQHQSRPHKNQQYSRNPNNSSTRQATSSSTNNHQQSWPTPSSRWSPNSRISPPPESTSSNYQKNFRSSSRHSNSNSTPTSAANETSNSMTSPLNRKAPHNESDAPDSTKESRSADSHFKSASRSESLISSNVSRDNSRMATSQAPESSTIHKSSPSSLSTIKSHSSMSKRSQLSSSSPSAPPIAKVSSSISDKIISKLLQNYAMKKGTNKALSDRPLDKMKAAIFSSGEIPEINYRNHEEFVRMFFNKEYMRESLSSMLGQESLDDGYFNDLPDRVDKESINSLIDFYNQMNSGSPMSLIGHKNSQKPGATSFVTNELSNAQHHQHCSSSNSAATSASRSAESRVAKALTKSTLPPPPPPN